MRGTDSLGIQFCNAIFGYFNQVLAYIQSLILGKGLGGGYNSWGKSGLTSTKSVGGGGQNRF